MFTPLEDFPPLFNLAVFAAASAVMLLIVFRLSVKPAAVRVARERLLLRFLEIRLFHHPGSVLARAAGRLLWAMLGYLGRLFVPLAIAALPIILLLTQLNLRYARRPLLPGEAALLIVHATNSSAVGTVSVDFPESLVRVGPLEYIPMRNWAQALFESFRVGRVETQVRAGEERVTKEVITGTGYPRLSAIRAKSPMWRRLFLSSEDALPASGLIELIEVKYPPRELQVGGIPVPWLAWYTLVALATTLVLRPFVGVEF